MEVTISGIYPVLVFDYTIIGSSSMRLCSRLSMTKRYKNVSIPEELYVKLEELIKSKKAGYVSVSDAVKDAIRELLRKYKILP